MKTLVGTLVVALGLAACGGGGGQVDARATNASPELPDSSTTTSAPEVLTTSISAGVTTDASTTTGGEASESSSGAAAPHDGDAPYAPIRVAVISDLNESYGSTSYAQSVHRAITRVVELQPDLVLSTGDMVAGQQAGLDYTQMWAAFHAAVSDPLAQAGLPLAVTPGNHDGSGYPEFAAERAVFTEQWSARKPDLEYLDDTHYPLRYSFTQGPALFVSIDATTIGALDFGQMSWLEAQLQAGADRPVKIVFGHLPLMPFASGREEEIIGDEALADMLETHGVTLFISGHHHAFYPGRRGSVRYVSMGCLGAGPRPLIGTETPAMRSVLLLEIDEDGVVTSLEALAGQNYDAPIPRESLPASLSYGEWTVTRDDVRQP